MSVSLTLAATVAAAGFAAAGTQPASAATSYPGACSQVSRNGTTLTTCAVQPSATNPSTFRTSTPISPETTVSNYHQTAVPSTTTAWSTSNPTGRKPVLVVFLGGTYSAPSNYTDITDEVATQGDGVLNLRYPDSSLVNTVCSGDDPCFTSYRGSSIYGPSVLVPGTTTGGIASPPYADTSGVDLGNSVMNRLVSLIDTQALQDGWWAQFVVPNSASPYRTDQHPTGAVPNWSKIVFAGHSQGGGDAAFVGATVPTLRRVVTLSAPTDSVPSSTSGYDNSATWVTSGQSSSQVSRYWGMRDTREGTYGPCTSFNWHNLGGLNSSLCPTTPTDETTHSWEVFVDQGAGAQNGSHFLVTTDRANAISLYAHDSTAVDDNKADGSSLHGFSTDRYLAWDYLFTANHSD
jgi:hypothetical protein